MTRLHDDKGFSTFITKVKKQEVNKRCLLSGQVYCVFPDASFLSLSDMLPNDEVFNFNPLKRILVLVNDFEIQVVS